MMLTDQLAMLLSTDWFLRHWCILGLFCATSDKLVVQDKLRKEVKAMIGSSSTFWNTSFSYEREFNTQLGFIDAFKNTKNEADIMSIIQVGVHHYKTVRNAMPRLETLFLEMFLEENIAEFNGLSTIDLEVLLKLSKFISATDPNNDYEEMCISSNTPWDRYIRSLTPEFPTYLSDLVSYLQPSISFADFLSETEAVLSRKAQQALLAWLQENLKRLAGERT